MKWIAATQKYVTPVFRGTRILVSDVLELLASGMTIKEMLEYPSLNEEMIREAIELRCQNYQKGMSCQVRGFCWMRSYEA